MAIAIMTKPLLETQYEEDVYVTLLCDNKGVYSKFANGSCSKLKHHKEPNTDLLLEYKDAIKHLNHQNEWVCSHQDKDVQ
jgi:hypothetical protein